MCIILALAAVITVLTALFALLDDFNWKIFFICLGILVVCIGFPFIHNDTPLKTTHYMLHTDYYNDIQYSKIMTIEYDKETYPWNTWNWLYNSDRLNTKISEYKPGDY